MADTSKYSNLPGIAWDQPDTYETSDVPEDNTNEFSSVQQSDVSKCSLFEADEETPLQAFKRLELETLDLMKEIERLKASNPKKEKMPDPVSVAANLESIKSRIISIIEPKLADNVTEPAIGSTDPKDIKGSDGSLTTTEELSRLVRIEQKLSRLETLIGKNIDEDKPMCISAHTIHKKGILETVRSLNDRVYNLDPNAHGPKVTNILAKLSKISTWKESLDKASSAYKIDELYSIISESENDSLLIEEVATRLNLLCQLEEQCSSFPNVMKQLESVEKKVAQQIGDNKKQLVELRDLFDSNRKAIEEMMGNIERRIKALKVE